MPPQRLIMTDYSQWAISLRHYSRYLVEYMFWLCVYSFILLYGLKVNSCKQIRLTVLELVNQKCKWRHMSCAFGVRICPYQSRHPDVSRDMSPSKMLGEPTCKPKRIIPLLQVVSQLLRLPWNGISSLGVTLQDGWSKSFNGELNHLGRWGC